VPKKTPKAITENMSLKRGAKVAIALGYIASIFAHLWINAAAF